MHVIGKETERSVLNWIEVQVVRKRSLESRDAEKDSEIEDRKESWRQEAT